MKYFRNYRCCIENRIKELLSERQQLIDTRDDVSQFISTKEYCALSIKILDKDKIIKELKNLLK